MNEQRSQRQWRVEWSEEFPVPIDRDEALARIKVIGTEIQSIQEQIAAARGGYVGTDDWEWRRRVGSAKVAKLNQIAQLKRWLQSAPPDRRMPPDSEQAARLREKDKRLRLALFLLHSVLQSEGALPDELVARIRALLDGSDEEPSDAKPAQDDLSSHATNVRDIRPSIGGAALLTDLTTIIKSNERRQVSGCWINNRMLTEWLSQARKLWTGVHSAQA